MIQAYQYPLRVLCVREFQNSIADSVHRLVADRVEEMGLHNEFEITQSSIRGKNGSEFIFKGIKQSPQEVKSMEGVDVAWYEEAQRASAESLKLLIPTIRKGRVFTGEENGGRDPELWFSWNPEHPENAIERLLRGKNSPPRAIIRKVGWQDNPFFPKVLDDERRYMLANDPIAYEHVWEGGYITIGDAVIFNKRVEYRAFPDPPPNVTIRQGLDFGFANDPLALIQFFVDEASETLFITHEAFGYGVEIDETPQFLDNAIPNVRKWPIKADCARPEIISYLSRKGFRISAAEKWAGSVEDGIAHMKGFKRIVVHERCKRIASEFRLYSYKTDKKQTDEKGNPLILPIIVDANNHGIDAVRYGLDGYIQRRGGIEIWKKLAR